MILVMDGRVQQHNLTQCGKDKPWLENMLGKMGLTAAKTYFAHVDTQGVLIAQEKGGGVRRVQAISPEEVTW